MAGWGWGVSEVPSNLSHSVILGNSCASYLLVALRILPVQHPIKVSCGAVREWGGVCVEIVLEQDTGLLKLCEHTVCLASNDLLCLSSLVHLLHMV